MAGKDSRYGKTTVILQVNVMNSSQHVDLLDREIRQALEYAKLA